MRNRSNNGIGVCDAVCIVFIVLKIVGVINWSWVWVLSPIWISLIILAIAYILYK